MKFHISSKTFYSYVSAVGKIINAKNALTILNNFKLTLEGNNLTITASDGENFLEGRVAVTDAEGEGSACVDARRLIDLLKELPDVGIEMSIDTDNTYEIVISYANGEFKTPGFSGNDYPVPDAPDAQEEGSVSFTAEASKLIRGIDHTIFAVGNDELRPQMMGIYWDLKPESLVFVATDTRKLVKYVDSSIKSGAETSFIMPVKSMMVMKNVFARQGDVTVTINSKGVQFRSADFDFNSRFLKGRFPDYNRVIPQNNPYRLTVERGAFLSAIRRIGSFCEGANGLVRLKISADRVILKASETSYNSSAWESVAASYEGQDLVIGFSAPYMSEILNSVGTKEVNVLLSDPSRPGVFVPDENEPDTELVMLLMPMLVAEF